MRSDFSLNIHGKTGGQCVTVASNDVPGVTSLFFFREEIKKMNKPYNS